MNHTEVHPLGLTALLILGLMVVVLPGRYRPIPILLMACLIPSAQRIVIFQLDWTYTRILVLAGMLAAIARGELRRVRALPVDYCVLALAIVTLTATTARTASMTLFVRNLGVAFDAIATYLLFRSCIRDWGDVLLLIRSLVIIGVPVSAAMLYERSTGYNVFHMFGGVPQFTLVREGQIRAQGAFSHPILAGCFWASLLPLFAALAAFKKISSIWTISGIGIALICIYCSASSTPVIGALAAILGGAFYPIRSHMRLVRWSLVGLLVLLQIVMKAPVWHLISRIDAVGGSTGWHRYILIDRSIHRFGEWALLGTDNTASWGWGMVDVTNEYLVRGFRGGFLAMCIFIAIIAFAYQAAGRLWRYERDRKGPRILAWALGVSLFSHTLMFIAVSYFGQIQILWWLLIAILASLASLAPKRKRARARSRPDRETGRRESHDRIAARAAPGTRVESTS
jgi:hypothetical protein